MLHTAVSPSLPASVVTHSVSGYFTPEALVHRKTKQILVVRQNHVTLYGATLSTTSTGNSATTTPKDHVGILLEVSLNSPPLAVATCRPKGTVSDLAIFLFDDFHVAFLQYNPLTADLDTVALVQLDDRQLSLDRCTLEPILRVDPSGSYVAVLAKRTELFFFPVLSMMSKEEATAAALARASKMDGAADGSSAATGGTTGAAGGDSQKAKAAPVVHKVALSAWGDEEEDDDTESKPDVREEEVALSKERNDVLNPQKEGIPSQQLSGAGILGNSVLCIGPVSHWTLQNVQGALRNVRDLTFVESSGEPLLAFLFEKHPTWAGRVKLLEWRSKTVEAHMLTCSIGWVTVMLADSASPYLLSLSEVDGLPYDVTSLTALPTFGEVPSAVLVVGRHIMVHVSTKSGYGVFINKTGEDETQSTKSSAVVYEPLRWTKAAQEASLDLVKVNLNFTNATVVLVASDNAHTQRLLLFTEEEGTIVDVRLQSQGYAVASIQGEIVTTGCFCASSAALDEERFFLGSLNGDSRLIRSNATTACKVLQRFTAVGPIRDMDAVAGDLMPQSVQTTLDPTVEKSPFADLYRSVSLDPLPEAAQSSSQAIMDLAVCTGSGSSGALTILRNSIRTHVVRQEELNATSAFFLEPANDRKRTREEGDVVAAASVANVVAHLLLTGINFSILFSVQSDSVQQVRGAALNVSSRTLYATYLDWMPALLQVTETEFRLVAPDGKRKLFSADLPTSSAKTPESKCVAKSALLIAEQHLLLVLFDDGRLAAYQLNDSRSVPPYKLVRDDVKAMAWWPSSSVLVLITGMDLVLLETLNGTVGNASTSTFPNFALLPPHAVEGVETPAVKLRERLNAEPLPVVTHLAVFDQHDTTSPARTEASLIIILSSGELMTYRVMPADRYGPRRCKKELYYILDVLPEMDVLESIKEKKNRLQEEREHLESMTQQMRHCSQRLVPFTNINKQRGIYVCGQSPVFLIFDPSANQLVPSRHFNTHAVRGFAPFHSRRIEGGFVYCGEGYVHFATMQPFGQMIGNGWWMERVAVGGTPHKVVYSPTAHGCLVVASTRKPFAPRKAPFDVQLRSTEDEEGNRTFHVEVPVSLPPMSASAGGPPVAMNDRYEIQFYSALDWRRTDCYQLDENEKALGASLVMISRDTSMDVEVRAATAPVCALATAYPLGEDVTSRGRVILLTVTTANGKQHLRLVHAEPMTGPVTAICGIEDCVAVAVGGTVRVFRLDFAKRSFETMAMLYAGAYVTHISAFREYLIIGDLHQSVILARFSAVNHTLTLLGKDTNMLSVVQNTMLYYGARSGMVVSDDQRQLIIMTYKPRVLEEAGKQTKILEALLTISGEYRLSGGSLVKMLRFRSSNGQRSSVALYVTNYGEIGYIVPLGDQTSRTGQWISRRLQSEVPHEAGLVPRAFLGFRQDDPTTALRGEEQLLHAPLLEVLLRQDLRTRKLIASLAQTQLDRALNVGATVAAETGLF